MPQKQCEFKRIRRQRRISTKDAARLFEVTERTIRNWDRRGAPRLAMRLLCEVEGRLDALHPDWKGWTISTNGKLYGPNRLQFSAAYLARWRSVLRCPHCDRMPNPEP